MSDPVLEVDGRNFPARLALVDLDGTLVDTAPDIARAVNAVADEWGFAEPGLERVRAWVGDGARRLMARALADGLGREAEETELDRAHRAFLDHYARQLVVDSQPMAGARALLDRLADGGVRIACVTNKPEVLARGVLGGLDLDGPVEWLVGGDTLETRKPDAGPLRYVAENAGFAPGACVVIGDSEVDVAAARNYGCSVICLSCGYNRGFERADSHPDAFVASLAGIAVRPAKEDA